VILDEFCRVCGYHRKYAIRLLNGPRPVLASGLRRSRGPSYGPPVIQALTQIWEAAGYPWSVRLKALLPLWLPWLRHRCSLSRATERQLLAISPRQIDRRLKLRKGQLRRRLYGRTKPGTLLKHHIPIKTDHRDVTCPGSPRSTWSRTRATVPRASSPTPSISPTSTPPGPRPAR